MSSSSEARYTCEIVFHRATNVPVADLNDLSSDPYVNATLTPLHNLTGDAGSPSVQSLSFRSQTSRKTLNPTFTNARWLVSGIPASGFALTLWLMDEDPGDHDDKLGRTVIPIPGSEGSVLREGWDTGEREHKIHKRHGGLRTRMNTYLARMFTRGRVRHQVRVYVSVRVLGPAPRLEGDNANRIYTLGPHIFVRHFSLLAARLASVQSLKATRLQLIGPVPSALRHRYVGFKPFVKAMFRAKGIEGMALHRALHQQHSAIYKWDKDTIWGVVEEQPGLEGEDKGRKGGDDVHFAGKVGPNNEKPDEAFARKFLDLVEYGTEGRVFTYVIMLDGQWRFTETGDEFAVQFLSKHTMHSDVSIEIAYSGEFFVRRMRETNAPRQPQPNGHTNGDAHHLDTHGVIEDDPDQDDGPSDEHASQPQDDRADPSSLPPSAYELVIDNDSGTYRPRKDLLPVLEAFLARPSNLGALGRVRALDGFDDRLKRWKEERKEEKRQARGAGTGTTAGKGKGKGKTQEVPVLRPASVSSSSSGSSSHDAGAIEAAAGDAANERAKVEEQEQQVQKAMEEDAKRAQDNQDQDPAAKEEEKEDAEPKTQS
ncbi:hypothetical protein BD310DRAFT_919941 [Dichomitus squalens]|uniref:C2 domain-containing protein n=1 Tax=Dichomitus squalens TaxID=114155 RepID=A0A4Q9Q5D1_9APHY|nr:hypothetical protein BD310DRAFT_919941 [Dichomitus squalens]